MANSEWDLGQALVERGVCTLDQVREALSIQDRMRQMGVAPKPLAEILLEKGYAREEQLAAAGALVAPRKPAPPRPPTRTLRACAPARPRCLRGPRAPATPRCRDRRRTGRQ